VHGPGIDKMFEDKILHFIAGILAHDLPFTPETLRIPPRDQSRAGRIAHRTAGISICEYHSLPGQPVDMRRFNTIGVIEVNVIPSQVIRQDDDNIGAPGGMIRSFDPIEICLFVPQGSRILYNRRIGGLAVGMDTDGKGQCQLLEGNGKWDSHGTRIKQQAAKIMFFCVDGIDPAMPAHAHPAILPFSPFYGTIFSCIHSSLVTQWVFLTIL
jgi:hypothetical protein